MLRVRNLTHKYQKRLIRPLYAQTQATPYAAVLDDTLRNTDGSLNLPSAAYKLYNGLVPGTVVTNLGEKVLPATGADANPSQRPFGLLANFVGGDLDDLGDENYVGVWRGPDAVFEILSPAFNESTGGDALSAAWAAASSGFPVPLYAGADGRLQYFATPGNRVVVAHLIERPTASRIVVDLRI
jgi:hypothetical protein